MRPKAWPLTITTSSVIFAAAGDTEPADLDEALRWCVIVDGIPECDADTAAIVYLERETGTAIIAALCGPAHDHNVAIGMVARDLKAEQSDGLRGRRAPSASAGSGRQSNWTSSLPRRRMTTSQSPDSG